MADLIDNPMGTDGFEFVEYTAPDPEQLRARFTRMGFPVSARHRSKNVTLHRRATHQFRHQRGTAGLRPAIRAGTRLRPAPWHSASRMPPRPSAARWSSAQSPSRRRSGRWTQDPGDRGHRRQPYLSRRSLRRPHDLRRGLPAGGDPGSGARGRAYADRPPDPQRGPRHTWTSGPGFYERLFNFREIRYFDIEGRRRACSARR